MRKRIALIAICAICAFTVGFCLPNMNRHIADEQPPIILIFKG